jgi:MinD-like ATPase involved in chromosome partitioning or flagellar assembly
MIKDYDGVDILPGSRGIEEMANLGREPMERLLQSFAELVDYDFLIFDTSAGISRDVISFCVASSEVIVVITPEPTSLTDGYALLKMMAFNGFDGVAKVIVNQCNSPKAAQTVYDKFNAAVAKYLGMKVLRLGLIYQDPKVVEAVQRQKPLLSYHPNCTASKCIEEIAQSLLEDVPEHSEGGDIAEFWRKFELIDHPQVALDDKEGSDKRETGPGPAEFEEEIHPDGLLRDQEDPSGRNDDSSGPETVSNGDSMDGANISPSADNGNNNENMSVSSSPPGTLSHSEFFLPMIEKLSESISSVSREIRLFREAIVVDGKMPTPIADSNSQTRARPQAQPIRLDLNSFLSRGDPERDEE